MGDDGVITVLPEPANLLIGLLVFGVLAALLVGAGILVGRDVEARGGSGLPFALLVIFVPPIGLLAWWFTRRRLDRGDADRDARPRRSV